MKPHYLKIASTAYETFKIMHSTDAALRGLWHFHPELELHHVIKGEGLRFVGDSVSTFSEGELVFVGSNLSHSWQNVTDDDNETPVTKAEVIVLQFMPDCLGRQLFYLPESHLIPELFARAGNGMVIHGKTREKIVAKLHQLVHARDLEKLILFLEILRLLSDTNEYDPVTFKGSAYQHLDTVGNTRINKVFDFTIANYMKEISLLQVASMCNLTVTSFCRYFKLMTRKSYYDFLTEIRISHACKFLLENKMTTSMICYECGFNNIANFYRHFKKITRVTPLQYKQKHLYGMLTFSAED